MSERFEIITPKSVLRSLKKIPLPWRERILDTMSFLSKNPFSGEKMMGELFGKRKIRVWPYRIIYKINIKRKHIIITDIGHRGSIGYK